MVQQASAATEALGGALTEAVATKTDLAALEARLTIAIKDAMIRTIFGLGGLMIAVVGLAFAGIKFLR